MVEQSKPRPPLTRAQIAAVAAGNGLEFYDFLTYSFFAAQIGRALFPGDAAHTLILSLATFGVGFVTRPLGGLLIGRYADRRGRKPAMILSFSLIGVAVTGLALTPSYAVAGMAAPILAVAFRMLQGFAVGGEMGPNVAFLMEAAPEGRRGFYISLNFATADLASLAAGLVGFGLSSALTAGQLESWGWRIALLIGAAIVPFGLKLRQTLSETLPEKTEPTEHRGLNRPLIWISIAGIMVAGGATISNYTLDYLTTYAQTTLAMPVPTAFLATIVIGSISVVGDLTAGWMADRFGAKRVLLIPWTVLLICAVPIFHVLSVHPTAGFLLGATSTLTIFHILGSTPAVILFVQALPARIRAGATGFIYAIAIATFGGSAQLIETMLIRWTGNPAAPGWYMAAAVAVAMTGAFLLPETVRRRPETPAVVAST